MQYDLSNQFAQVTVKKQGAELCSFKNKATNTEHIWQADPNVWSRHAPVLFPIVGALKDKSYTVDEKSYSLPQHGFARDMPFELISQSESSLIFQLSASKETLKKYPYNFQLQVKYTLLEKKLLVEYVVTNTDSNSIYFSIGAHPGFRVPFFENEALEDYYLEFSHAEKQDKLLLSEKGFISDKVDANYLNDSNKIELTKDLFNADALIFTKLNSEWIKIKSKQHEHEFTFYFKDYPYFGIWAKPGAPFVCLEPWHGIADFDNANGDLKSKTGIEALEPGGVFSCNFAIEA